VAIGIAVGRPLDFDYFGAKSDITTAAAGPAMYVPQSITRIPESKFCESLTMG